MEPVYLDYNATTPIDKEVIKAMLPYVTDFFGNPSSSHSFGIKTRMAVETAREQVAAMINCKPSEVYFTGGGTESNNMAIKGAAYAGRHKGNHIIISAIEHPAVTEVAYSLKEEGFEISYLPVDERGTISPAALVSLMRPDTILVSVMHANNEIGTVEPIKELAAIAHARGVLFHTDAAQSAGKVVIDVNDMDVDLLSIAGHKLYAPKGVGALYVRSGVRISKLLHGANHEHNMRPGTENVPYIVALGRAAELVHENLDGYSAHMRMMSDKIEQGLIEAFPDIKINGNADSRLPNTLNVSFHKLGAETVIRNLSDVAVSAGAACHASGGGSGTLQALGLPVEYSYGAMRISTGRNTTEEEVERAIESIVTAAKSAYGLQKPVPVAFKEIKLTSFAENSMGCGCKMRPADLEFILKELPKTGSNGVLVNAESRDDAAAYLINDEDVVIETVDFFTPMVDDAYSFGAIAAANAISDVYAMGAEPIFALNMVAFPVEQLPLLVLKDIMRGASDKAAEAGIPILGGHSIEDSGIKFGMVVTGRVKKDKLITNAGAKPGDVLILTKPLGSGIMSKALALNMLTAAEFAPTIKVMAALNKKAADCMSGYKVNACTDITGFGLTGHLHEVAAASNVDAVVHMDKLPVIDNVERMALAGCVPRSTKANIDFAGEWTDFGTLSDSEIAIVCDAQTSGGLLISLPAGDAELLTAELMKQGVDAHIIGNVTSAGTGKLKFV